MNGYQTDKPCDVCDQVFFNLIEPRFGYVVCIEHYDVKPVELARFGRTPARD